MHDQCGHIDFFEVLEVGLGKCLDAVVGVLEAGLHAPQPKLVEQSLRDACAGPIAAIEHHGKVFVELRNDPWRG